jgi:hypothetical protein
MVNGSIRISDKAVEESLSVYRPREAIQRPVYGIRTMSWKEVHMWCHHKEKYCTEQEKEVCLRCRDVAEEKGVTETSLDNGLILKMRHGRVEEITLVKTADKPGPLYRTRVKYVDGYCHEFTGFSWGYCGEGCHGLVAWAHNNDLPQIDFNLVSHLDNKKDGVVLHLKGLSTL